MGHKHATRHHAHATTATTDAPTPGKGTHTEHLPAAGGAYAAFQQMNTAIISLEQTITLWNMGLDTLRPDLIHSAGDMATAQWRVALTQSPATYGTDFQGPAESLLGDARAQIGRLGLYHAGKQHIRFAPEPALDPFLYVPHAVARAVACIADVAEVVAHAQDPALDGMGRMRIAQLFQKHLTDDLESRWMQAIIEERHLQRAVFDMEGLAGDLVRKLGEKQETEGYFRGLGYEVSAKTAVDLDRDADEMIDLASGGDAGASDYLAILSKHEPADRTNLLRLLYHRGALDNCVHRGGGDDLIAAIHATPSFGAWDYSYARVTEKSALDRAESSVKEMAEEAPGAVLSEVAGVYDGMSEIPGISPYMKKAAQSFRDLRDYTDDEIGVNKEHTAVRDAIASTAGHAATEVAFVAAGGEIEAADAARAAVGVKDVKNALDAGSTLEKAADTVLELRGAYLEATEDWETVRKVIEEGANAAGDLVADTASGDGKTAAHALEHLSKVFDIGIDKLGELLGAKMAGEAKTRKKEDDDARWKAKSTAAQHAAGDQTATVELQREEALALAAGKRAARKRSAPARRKQALAELEEHRARASELARQQSQARMAAEARAAAGVEQERKADEKQDKADDKAIQGPVEYYKHALKDEVKELIVNLAVGALQGANESLKKQADKLLAGTQHGVDLRAIVVEACVKGATRALTEQLETVAKKALTKVLEKIIKELVAQIDPDLADLVSKFDSQLEQLVETGLDALGAKDAVEHAIEGAVSRAFGVEEEKEGADGGEKEGGKEGEVAAGNESGE